MVIVLLGASGTGKSTIEKELANHHNYEKIISYTTRTMRDCEENGKDYFFTNLETFIDMKNSNLFAEYDEYSQHRLYGTLKSDYLSGNKVVVLTPNGLRKIKKSLDPDQYFTVLVESPLGTRVKRYINRCGEEKFNFDDMNEINARVNRDFGMFVGMENEVDFVVNNDDLSNITEIAESIIEMVNAYV